MIYFGIALALFRKKKSDKFTVFEYSNNIYYFTNTTICYNFNFNIRMKRLTHYKI